MPSSPLARLNPAADSIRCDEARDIEAIYRRHAAQVGRWATRLLGHGADSEDIVHQVFLVAQRRLQEFRGDAKITTWLHEITIRVVQETRRKRRRWWRWSAGASRSPTAAEMADAAPEDELAALPSEQPTALELLEKKDASNLVYALLDQLDDKYRTALILFELDGLTGQEIAAVTNTSLSNVWVRLLRGRQQFLKRFVAWEASGGAKHHDGGYTND
jgi:RNA polymerase sigma-70 factor (ECF subfamily)